VLKGHPQIIAADTSTLIIKEIKSQLEVVNLIFESAWLTRRNQDQRPLGEFVLLKELQDLKKLKTIK
jgi:hypothetical protein